LEAMISVHLHPVLHRRLPVSRGPCGRRGVVTFERQENGAIAIALRAHQILWMAELDVHATVPPAFSRVWQMLGVGATSS
jgi:hypothetical protein